MCNQTSGAIPGVRTDTFFGSRMNFVFAIFTIPISIAHIGYTVHKLMFRTVPTVFTKRRFFGIVTPAVTVIAFGAIPIPAGATFVVSVSPLIFGTTPSMLTGGIRTVTGTVAVVAVDAPPEMRAAVRLGINHRRVVAHEAVPAEPVTVRATVGQPVAYLTGRTIPVMFARFPDVVCRTAGRVRAIPAVRRCCGTDVIRRVNGLAGCAVPVMFAICFKRIDLLATFFATIAIGIDRTRIGF